MSIELNRIFIHPDGHNKEYIRKVFHEAGDLLMDALSGANDRPVLPPVDAFASARLQVPDDPLAEGAIVHELQEIIRLSMNPARTTYIGHMDSLPTLYSIIGSLYSAALNNNMFSLEMSPYFTRLEYALVRQFSELFGYGEEAGGVIVSGGTLANVQAILTARNYHLQRADGEMSHSREKLVVLASEHAHVSIPKAAMIGGIGTDQVIRVAADTEGKMRPDDLQAKIAEARASGLNPFVVIGTIGTTVTGNIDPIREVGIICREHGLWYHADAIYGGALILSSREKRRLAGIEGADSICFNPQKWMHISKTCSLLLFRDRGVMHDFFRLKSNYTKAQDLFVNLSEISLQGTRHAEVLKLWLSLLSVGWKGYGQLVDRACAITKTFRAEIGKLKGVEFASVCEMNITTFRLRSRLEEINDRVNEEFNDFAMREYNIFFSLPRYRGQLWQRTILLNPFLDERTIDQVRDAIQHFVNRHVELQW